MTHTIYQLVQSVQQIALIMGPCIGKPLSCKDGFQSLRFIDLLVRQIRHLVGCIPPCDGGLQTLSPKTGSARTKNERVIEGMMTYGEASAGEQSGLPRQPAVFEYHENETNDALVWVM